MKPLYVYEDAASFIFSSEIRAMLPWRRFDVDPSAATAYLFGRYVFTRGSTLLGGVELVSPGSVVTVVRGQRARSRQFFCLSDLWQEDQHAQLESASTAAIDVSPTCAS